MAEAELPRGEQVDRPSLVRFAVLAWLCAAAAIAYVHRQCLAVPVEQIQDELAIDNEQMGWIFSGFFLTYAIFQIPTGWLGDRWGSRRALSVFSLLWSTATALMAVAFGPVFLLTTRLVNGAAQAGLFPCAVNTIARWFPLSQRGLPNGLLGAFMSGGGIVATIVTAFLLQYLSWQALFFWLAWPGILWSLGFSWWFRNRPEEHSQVNRGELEQIRAGREAAADAGSGPIPWLVLLTSPLLLLICGQQFFRGAAYVFYQTWFPKFLQQSRGVSEEAAGYLTSLPLLGVVLGSILGGLIADWLQARTGSRRLCRQGLALASLAGCAVFLHAAYFIEAALPAVLVITAASFCHGVAGPAGYAITIDVGGRHVATVFSIMNMSGNLGGTACPPVVARLVEAFGDQWNIVLPFLGGLYLSAGLCWLMINPERSIFAEEALRRGPTEERDQDSACQAIRAPGRG